MVSGPGRGQPRDDRQTRHAGHLQPLPDRMGGRVLHPVQDVQTVFVSGRCRRSPGHLLAQGNRGAWRGPRPIPPLHRYRARNHRSSGASRGQYPRGVVQGAGGGDHDGRLGGRDLRPGFTIRWSRPVFQGRQGHLHLQLPGHRAGAAGAGRRTRAGPAHHRDRLPEGTPRRSRRILGHRHAVHRRQGGGAIRNPHAARPFQPLRRGSAHRLDVGDPVSSDYHGKFEFSGGEIAKVVFDIADDAYVDVEKHYEAALSRD